MNKTLCFPYINIQDNNQNINIWNVEALDLIKKGIFQGNLPEELSQIILSTTKSSDLKLEEKKWGIEPQDLTFKIELARFGLLLNNLLHQIENIKERNGSEEMAYPYVYLALSGVQDISEIDTQTTKEFLLKQRQLLIENISLLPPMVIKQLKIDFGTALPMGFGLPNILDVAWHFSWVRKATGDTIGHKVSIDATANKWCIIGNSIEKICELEGNDWRLVLNIIEAEKTRDRALLAVVKYLINHKQKDKAKEVAEIIFDFELQSEAIAKIQNE